MEYTIKKTTYPDYDLYQVFLQKKLTYWYYQKSGNTFTNYVYVMMDISTDVGEFLPNSIYIFCRGFQKIKNFIQILEQEFNNLHYAFIFTNEYFKTGIMELAQELVIDIEAKTLEEYFQITSVSKDIKVSNLNKNQALLLNDKNYANYKGFNERFVDDNVKNIVQIKKETNPNMSNAQHSISKMPKESHSSSSKNIPTKDKTYANYNGFNERLIDNNVKNIVQIKRNGGEKNEQL